MARATFAGGPDFSSEALGGKERVEMLMTSLQKLKDRSSEPCSFCDGIRSSGPKKGQHTAR